MYFLDTTILVGAGDARDACHADARTCFAFVASGKAGAGLISDYVLDEALTILAKRGGVGAGRAVAFVTKVLHSPRIRVLHVDEDTFAMSLRIFPRHDGVLSFTDTTTVCLMQKHGCKHLFSHDAGFDRCIDIIRQTRPP
ncbi:MAG: type II toxin-antitoxin system VapC family toxin [Thermoplasmatota archaeon]